MAEDRLHPSHQTRISDASSFDEICVNCGATDITGGGWDNLAKPCPNNSFAWFNRFNQIEKGGPFPTLEAAKADAVKTFTEIQDGFAFDLEIMKGGTSVARGHMKEGKWIDGDFTETKEEQEARLKAPSRKAGNGAIN